MLIRGIKCRSLLVVHTVFTLVVVVVVVMPYLTYLYSCISREFLYN